MNLLVQIALLNWARVVMYGMLAAALYFFLLYDGGSNLIEQNGQKKEQLKVSIRQLEDTKKAIQDANRFEQEVKILQNKFERITEFMPKTLKVADLTTLIYDEASMASIRITKTDPETKSGKGDFFDTLRIKISFEGEFVNVVRFFSNLSKRKQLITFEDSSFEVVNREGNKSSVRFDGSLVGYRYTRVDDDGKDKANPK